MKFTIEREHLRTALDAIVPVVSTKTTLPVLGNVLVQAREGTIRFAATDLDTGMSVAAPAETTATGDALIPAKRLQEIAKQLPAGTVRFAAASENRIGVESGKSRFKLLGMPTAEFPAFPKVDFPGTWATSAGLVRQLIDQVSFAASREESRPVLNGILWEFSPSQMRMVATNGHRLAQADVAGDSGWSTSQLIVPPKALDLFRRAFVTDDAAVAVASTDSHIAFQSGDTFLFSRLIEGPYPDYTRVIPKENNRSVTVDRDALLAAVRRVSVLADAQTHLVRLTGLASGIKVSTKSPDLGEAADEVAGTWEGEGLEIGFDATYLMEILKRVPTDEVRLTFKAPERAATIEPVGDAGAGKWLAVLMPRRVIA